MLDRKTKDYEASEELLEDRLEQTKHIKIFSSLLMLLITMTMFFLLYSITKINFTNSDITMETTYKLWGLLLLLVSGCSFFISIMIISGILYTKSIIDERYYSMLLFIKKTKK